MLGPRLQRKICAGFSISFRLFLIPSFKCRLYGSQPPCMAYRPVMELGLEFSLLYQKSFCFIRLCPLLQESTASKYQLFLLSWATLSVYLDFSFGLCDSLR